VPELNYVGKTSLAKFLTWDGELREAQIEVPLSLSHSHVWPRSYALYKTRIF